LLLLNGLILLFLIAGQVEILVAIVNRSHSFPVKFGVLRQFRHVHDGLLIVFPCLLIGWVGLWEPGVLRGGSWYELHFLWTAWLAVCTCGFVSLVFCTLRWQFRSRPRCLMNEHSVTRDIGRALGNGIVGTGEFQFLTRVPGNQFLELEIAEKVYGFPLTGRDELSILHLTDFHFTGIPDLPYYKAVIDAALEREYDLVVFTGDLLDDPELLAWLPETIGRLSARLGCYYILGNHDWGIGDAETRTIFDSFGWIDVSGLAMEVPGTESTIVIAGSEYPWMGQNPDFANTPQAATRILLSHGPDNFAWARENSVDLMLSGHNHGGQVVLPVIGPVYSPSWSGVKYSCGDFYSKPTLLHVCRGLGARHPLRINCRPEIATLVLRDTSGIS
jgi:predicted MPP superfamily phosphohydrolase